MKKTLALILTLAMFLTTLVGCQNKNPFDASSTNTSTESAAESNVSDTVDESLKRKMAGDWSIYLTHIDDMAQQMYWLIDYTELFFESPTWDNLLVARAAISAVRENLAQQTFPDYSLTAEQHAEMIAAGCDVSGFLTQMNQLENIRDEFIANCDSMLSEFYTGIFFAPLFDTTKEYTTYVKNMTDAELKLAAHYTENLMLSLHSQTLSEDFLTFIKKNTPCIANIIPDFSDDYSVIIQNVQNAIEDYDACLDLLNTNIGKRMVANDRLAELLNNGDIQTLQTYKTNISGDSNCFALPVSYNYLTTVCTYLYTDADQQLHYTLPCEPFTNTPNRCVTIISDVTETDYKSYIVKLIDLGIEPYKTDDHDNEYTAYFLFGEDGVITEFKDGKITIKIIGSSIHLVPIYYLR